MAKCPPGRIYVSEHVRRAAGDVFVWKPIAPMRLKGKAEPVAGLRIGRLDSGRRHEARRATTCRWSGGEAELGALAARLDEALQGRGQIVGICAEAGMGKSRLVAEFVRLAGAAGRRGRVRRVPVVRHEHRLLRMARSVVRRCSASTPACPSRSRCARSRPSSRRSTPGSCRARRCSQRSSTCRSPTTSSPRSSTRSSGRHRSKGCSSQCLRARAAEAPLVLVLEDCHWLDPLSRDLAEVLGRALASLPVLLVLAYRPDGDAGGRLGVEKLPHFGEIVLSELDAVQAGATHPVEARPAHRRRGRAPRCAGRRSSRPRRRATRSTSRSCSPTFAARVSTAAGRIGAQGAPASGEPAQPDPLAGSTRSTSRHGARSRWRACSDACSGRRCCPPSTRSSGGPPTWTRTCGRWARPTSSTSTRRPSRRISSSTSSRRKSPTRASRSRFAPCSTSVAAATSRRAEPDSVERHLDLLAHHYWRSENLPKKREYLGRAGDAAQAAYANAAAIGYFERLAPLVEQARARRRAAEARQGARGRRRVAPGGEGRGRGARVGEEPRRPARVRVVRDGARRGRAQAGPLRRGGRAAGSCDERIPGARRRGRRRPGAASRRARSPRSAATTPMRSRTTRRVSRFASGWATRRAWAACCRISASSPSTAAIAMPRGASTSALLRSASRSAIAGRSPCRRTTWG